MIHLNVFYTLSKPIFIVGISFLLGLQLYAQQPQYPVDSSYNVQRVFEQTKKRYPDVVPAIDTLKYNIVDWRDQVYTTLKETPFGTRELRLDIFRPDSKALLPAVIMLHGGGWRSGTKQMQVPMAQLLAQKGFVTIPVEYQLSLEAAYPAAVYNIKSAIRWVRANAERFHIDTSKIAISGCSAGGQLAALVGLTGGNEKFEGQHGNPGFSTEIDAIIDIDGVIDFMAPASLNLARKPDSPDVSWLGGTFEQKPLIWKEASSIFWANASSARPMLFINSGFSRFHAGQDELIGIMKELGVSTEVFKFDVQVHPFWLFHPWVDTTVSTMSTFLKQNL